MTTKTENPGRRCHAAPGRVDFSKANAPENNAFSSDLQRLRLMWLTRRFRLPPAMAHVVASVAFTVAGAQQ